MAKNQIYLREEITINFLFIYYVTSYAVCILAQCLVKRKTANNTYLNEYLASKMKMNNMGIFVAILAPVSARLIQTSDWDQNSGVRLVFGLSEKTEQKTNPKSEVAHCPRLHGLPYSPQRFWTWSSLWRLLSEMF